MIKSHPNCKERGKEPQKVIYEPFKKYGRKRSYHRSGNITLYVKLIRKGM
jgi:hypothetical protein